MAHAREAGQLVAEVIGGVEIGGVRLDNVVGIGEDCPAELEEGNAECSGGVFPEVKIACHPVEGAIAAGAQLQFVDLRIVLPRIIDETEFDSRATIGVLDHRLLEIAFAIGVLDGEQAGYIVLDYRTDVLYVLVHDAAEGKEGGATVRLGDLGRREVLLAIGPLAVGRHRRAQRVVFVSLVGYVPAEVVGRLQQRAEPVGFEILGAVRADAVILGPAIARLEVGDEAAVRILPQRGEVQWKLVDVGQGISVAQPTTGKLLDVVVDRFVAYQLVCAVSLVRRVGGAHGELLAQWQVEHPTDALAIVCACGDVDPTFHLLGARAIGNDVDGAGSRVAARQGSLRSARHLDALYVVEQLQGGLRSRRVHAVDVE